MLDDVMDRFENIVRDDRHIRHIFRLTDADKVIIISQPISMLFLFIFISIGKIYGCRDNRYDIDSQPCKDKSTIRLDSITIGFLLYTICTVLLDLVLFKYIRYILYSPKLACINDARHYYRHTKDVQKIRNKLFGDCYDRFEIDKAMEGSLITIKPKRKSQSFMRGDLLSDLTYAAIGVGLILWRTKCKGAFAAWIVYIAVSTLSCSVIAYLIFMSHKDVSDNTFISIFVNTGIQTLWYIGGPITMIVFVFALAMIHKSIEMTLTSVAIFTTFAFFNYFFLHHIKYKKVFIHVRDHQKDEVTRHLLLDDQ